MVETDVGWNVRVVGCEDGGDPEAGWAWAPSVDACRSFGPKAFGYAPGFRTALSDASPAIVDVQGLWAYPSLANWKHHRRTRIPYLITPHGMLDPWARERSAWKKKLVRRWFEDAHLAGAACLRATADMEAEHFRSFGLKNPIAIVPNGIELPDLAQGHPPGNGRHRLLFLSRIHPKKGLRYLLQAWARLEPYLEDWELVIAGPDEVSHTAEMQALARQLKLQRVIWHSAVHGAEKSALYQSADLFVLPTHAENFGLVVAEALAHGVPVVTTQNAPWAELEIRKCGWWIPLETKRLSETLLTAMRQPSDVRKAMGARGRAWMEQDFGWANIAEKMLAVYEAVAHGAPVPRELAYQ